MKLLSFLPKTTPEMPDFFSIEVFYIDGKSDKFDCVLTKMIGVDRVEIWTKDNLCELVFLSNVKKISYDSKFTKIVELKVKNDSKNTNQTV